MSSYIFLSNSLQFGLRILTWKMQLSCEVLLEIPTWYYCIDSNIVLQLAVVELSSTTGYCIKDLISRSFGIGGDLHSSQVVVFNNWGWSLSSTSGTLCAWKQALRASLCLHCREMSIFESGIDYEEQRNVWWRRGQKKSFEWPFKAIVQAKQIVHSGPPRRIKHIAFRVNRLWVLFCRRFL